MPKILSSTRRFDGKTYHFAGGEMDRSRTLRVSKILRGMGYNVRTLKSITRIARTPYFEIFTRPNVPRSDFTKALIKAKGR